MKCEIVTIGTELLLGDTVNTNAAWLSRQLALYGISLYQQRTVGDNRKRIVKVLRESLEENDIVITTGGLGPTVDDITRECAAEVLGADLVINTEALEKITGFFKSRGYEMAENNRKQAMFPAGSTILDNEVGTAPGCLFEKGNKTLVLLPGPPHELTHMFELHIIPYLEKITGTIIHSRTVRVCGIGESEMEKYVLDIIEASQNPTVAPYASMGECKTQNYSFS
jgi:nicotinamide-nucleotide amidase